MYGVALNLVNRLITSALSLANRHKGEDARPFDLQTRDTGLRFVLLTRKFDDTLLTILTSLSVRSVPRLLLPSPSRSLSLQSPHYVFPVIRQ